MNNVAEMAIEDVADVIDIAVDGWVHQCHMISLAIVKSGLIPGGRVARGSCHGVGGQHSWIVDGRDCYDRNARIIDPTLWSYVDLGGPTIWTGRPEAPFNHTPHGAGSIWQWGQPRSGSGAPIPLPTDELSSTAKSFLKALGPLDAVGWQMLFSQAPVEGWPAGEILAVADKVPSLSPLIPIDKLGMLTDINPSGLYW